MSKNKQQYKNIIHWKPRLYNLNSTLQFGKYRNTKIDDIEDKEYLVWLYREGICSFTIPVLIKIGVLSPKVP